MCTCNFNSKNFKEKFDYSVNNKPDGITIEVKPKDKTKVESLQKFAEAYQEFCEADCC